MNKAIKTILIISLTVIGTGFLAVPSTFVQAQPQPPLVVQFEKTPLFNEVNFLPGEDVTRWVKVTNNSGETKPIATEAINYPGFPNKNAIPAGDLSRALLIIIREKGGGDLYGGSAGEKTLFNFYQNGETYLSDILNGNTEEYEFEITFPFEKENEWQAATTTFDILIGFQGSEGMGVCGNGVKEGVEQCDGTDLGGQTCTGLGYSGGTLSCNQSCNFDTSACTSGGGTTGGGGGGGGVSLPPGLTIFDEASWNVTETSVTIIWTTTYFSTSQVIYGAEGEAHTLKLSDNTGTPPKYGYASTTPEYDTSPKVTGHSVTITGLTPGTTYYYRAVSHASLAISREFTFTTLGVKEIGEIGGEIPTEEIPPSGGELPSGEVVPAPGEAIEKPEGFVPEEAAPAEGGIVTVFPEERVAGESLAPLLLASLGVIGKTPWMAIVVIFSLIGLVVIGIREWELARKKKKNIS